MVPTLTPVTTRFACFGRLSERGPWPAGPRHDLKPMTFGVSGIDKRPVARRSGGALRGSPRPTLQILQHDGAGTDVPTPTTSPQFFINSAWLGRSGPRTVRPGVRPFPARLELDEVSAGRYACCTALVTAGYSRRAPSMRCRSWDGTPCSETWSTKRFRSIACSCGTTWSL